MNISAAHAEKSSENGFFQLFALIAVALLALGSISLLVFETRVIAHNPKNLLEIPLVFQNNKIETTSESASSTANIEKATSTQATLENAPDITPATPPEKPQETPPQPLALPVPIVNPPRIEIVPAAAPLPSLSALNTAARPSIVNILCTSKRGGSLEPASGSGVIIDPRGIILTNAHVAQYFLLKDYKTKDFVNCVVRTGSPAQARYTAELLYISQRWVGDNPNINEQSGNSTGANDFALLRITGRTDQGTNLPSSFSALSPEFDDENIASGDNGVVLGYPAGFLEGISIQHDLFLTSAVVTIGNLYSLSSGPLDLFSIGGSVVAQQGSSGGAFVRQKSGKLAGIVTLSTLGGTTSDRDLRVLTLSHINRAFKRETDISFNELFELQNLTALARQFNEDIAPALTKIMTDALGR